MMSKGRMSKTESLPEETILVSLVNTPRCKVELIEFNPSAESRETKRHFILRKIKYFAPDNIKGYEIKIEMDGAKKLHAALGQLTD